MTETVILLALVPHSLNYEALKEHLDGRLGVHSPAREDHDFLYELQELVEAGLIRRAGRDFAAITPAGVKFLLEDRTLGFVVQHWGLVASMV